MDDPQGDESAEEASPEGSTRPGDPPEGASHEDALPDPPPLGPAAFAFLTLGVAWAVALAVGWAIGYLVDRWADTSPLFGLVGLFFGLVVAVLMTIARVRRYL